MHALWTIVHRNLEAAGYAAGSADRKGNTALANAVRATTQHDDSAARRVFDRAYTAALQGKTCSCRGGSARKRKGVRG